MSEPQEALKKAVLAKVRTEPEEYRAWAAAAAADGRSLSGWVRKACAEKLAREKAGAS